MLSKNKFSSIKLLSPCFLSGLMILGLTNPAFANSVEQTAITDSQVEGDANNVIQIPNQNNLQNHNDNDIELSTITPLVSPPNTENDLGFNLSVGVNDSEATVYLGVIFQPGRTDAHQTRMQYLEKQNEFLEVQTQLAEAKLMELQSQLEKE